ncbi:MAG TPA: Xaa-Pro peptidase family protein [Candidatus Binatia bacterium]|jgi:Xaa-Pro aminopeptidase
MENELIPQLSLEERDRRYKNVREEMAQRGIDVLLLPANSGRWEQLQADSRYLSSIGGFATEIFTVFPCEAEPTAYVFNRAAWWKRVQRWVADVRDGRNQWAENAIERLKEIGFESGTIGISGLSGLFRAPEGIIPYTTVAKLQAHFSRAKIVNATEMMQQVRAVKSAEEIALLERSAALIEKMIATMRETARPGITDRDLYAAMTQTMLAGGGELPTLFFIGSGSEIAQSSFVPTSRQLEAGDRIVNEIEAKIAGYAAQAVAPLSLGEPAPEYRTMVELSAECFHEILGAMRPGVTFGALFDVYTGTIERAGGGKYSWSHPVMHARGLGDDGPALLGDKDLERFRKIELQSGMVFILKPQVRATSGKGRASIGDTVVVTERGARRLGTRELKLLVSK